MALVTDSQVVARWMILRMEHGYLPPDAVCMGWEKDGRIVAGVAFDQYNGASICMHVVGEGQWLTRAFLRMAFWYPFEQLKVNKIIGLVPSTNARAIRFDEHLGFVKEAIIAEAVPRGDLLVYSMTRKQCRYLEHADEFRKV